MEQLTPQQLQTLLQASETKALAALLQQDGGAAWQQASQALAHGDYAKVQSVLKPLCENKAVGELARKLGQKLG